MELEAALIEELRREHRVHTLVLYGSRARGDATPESDVDVAGFAGALLEQLADLDRRGPPALAESEQRMRRVWAHKMLARLRRGDGEAHYRHHWLLCMLLEDYFALRGEWYRGPKQALDGLQRHAPATFAAFERALVPGAPFEALEALVAHVVDGGTREL